MTAKRDDGSSVPERLGRQPKPRQRTGGQVAMQGMMSDGNIMDAVGIAAKIQGRPSALLTEKAFETADAMLAERTAHRAAIGANGAQIGWETSS